MKKQIKHKTNKLIKTFFALAISVITIFSIQSCGDTFLDVVPDNLATIDHIFRLRNEAEKALNTCYSYLPRNGDFYQNIGMMAGDEMWTSSDAAADLDTEAGNIAKGNQRASNPYANAWNGSGDRYSVPDLFEAIYHCNLFLENLNNSDKIPDLDAIERKRWTGEIEFLKAYYHYYLLRMYGPIPIIDVNLPLDASEEEINVKRRPIDECVTYISDLLDSAAAKLPNLIADRNLELGRATKPIALAIKAKLLVMAASPLFNNGNSEISHNDFSSLKNTDGSPLFNSSYDENKWKLAADAALSAIEAAEQSGNQLYEFPILTHLSDTTQTQMSIRQAVCERFNAEIVWGNSNSGRDDTWNLQLNCMPRLLSSYDNRDARGVFSPPLKIAKMFYSKNGVPINEDKTLDFTNDSQIRTAVATEKYNIEEGSQTARINFDREPRFYADLGFDKGVWYKYDSPSQSDENTWVVKQKFKEAAGSQFVFFKNETGYFVKKLVDWNQANGSGFSTEPYAWPEIRLADLYLLYAEALNESEGPSSTVYEYIDKIRTRAGLEGVESSWTNFSINSTKHTTKSGLREIIHQERLIELAFEGHRYWDLQRWKKSAEILNTAITGWNITGEDVPSYYQVRTVFQQKFVSPRDYFWPIPVDQLIKNRNLVQNVGW